MQRRARHRSYARVPRVARNTPGLFKKIIRFFSGGKWSLEVEERIQKDIIAVGCIALSVLTYLSLASGLGVVGTAWAEGVKTLFGIGALFVPAIFLIVGVLMLSSSLPTVNATRIAGLTLLTVSCLGIVHLSATEAQMLSAAREFGGLVGFVASVFFQSRARCTGRAYCAVCAFSNSLTAYLWCFL